MTVYNEHIRVTIWEKNHKKWNYWNYYPHYVDKQYEWFSKFENKTDKRDKKFLNILSSWAFVNKKKKTIIL